MSAARHGDGSADLQIVLQLSKLFGASSIPFVAVSLRSLQLFLSCCQLLLQLSGLHPKPVNVGV